MINLLFVASDAIDALLDTGNFVGAIIMIFTEKMGTPIFFGFVFLGLSTALYIRYQSIVPIAFLAILLFSAFRPVIPTNAIGLVLVLISLAVGILLYQLFLRSGRR